MKRLMLLLALPATGCVASLQPLCPAPPNCQPSPCAQGSYTVMRPPVVLQPPVADPDEPPAPVRPEPSAVIPGRYRSTDWVVRRLE